MSTKTTNYKFIKPELTDPADITATNVNWDVVDVNLKKIEDDMKEASNSLQSKITYGTSTPSGGKSGDVYIQIIEE